MLTVYPNLDAKMVELKISCPKLAEQIGMEYLALWRRMTGSVDWKLHEAVEVCRVLNCNDIPYLFLRLDTNSSNS